MKVWTIDVKDTGESIILTCGEQQVVERYNPTGSQSLQHPNDRDEAIGAAWAWMVDQFEKEEPNG